MFLKMYTNKKMAKSISIGRSVFNSLKFIKSADYVAQSKTAKKLGLMFQFRKPKSCKSQLRTIENFKENKFLKKVRTVHQFFCKNKKFSATNFLNFPRCLSCPDKKRKSQ